MDLWKEAYLGAEPAQQVISETRMETGDSRKSGVSHTKATLTRTRRKTRAITASPWLTEMSHTPLRLALTPCTLTPRVRTRRAPLSTTCDSRCSSILRILLWRRQNSAPSLSDPPSSGSDWLNMCARVQSWTNREVTSSRVPRQWSDSPEYKRWVRFTCGKVTCLQMS